MPKNPSNPESKATAYSWNSCLYYKIKISMMLF